jgi:hypothetical protein
MGSDNWKINLAEDFLSLGSIIFFIIVIARALIGPYWIFVLNLLISAICAIIFWFIFRQTNNQISRAIILVVFTALFYNEIKFTFFVIIILFLILISAIYLKKEKKGRILGFISGIISSLISYWLSPIIARFFNLVA